jgi:hypothetical protein
MKQSSIEWLMEIDKSRAITIEEWQQAREMEKEQMLKTFAESRVISVECAVWNCEGDRKKWESFEQYYNETFNSTEDE